MFYSTFFAPHGFVVPRKLILQKASVIPEELKAVMRWVGSHYQPSRSQEALRNAALKIRTEGVAIDPGFRVQGLLCLSIVFMGGYSPFSSFLQFPVQQVLMRCSWLTEKHSWSRRTCSWYATTGGDCRYRTIYRST